MKYLISQLIDYIDGDIKVIDKINSYCHFAT